MKELIQKRINAIKEAENCDDLRKCVCPFYEKGGHPDCMFCKKTDEDVEECRDFYMEHIVVHPMDVWCEDFDRVLAIPREKTSVSAITGVGITCNNCYMNTRCPVFKKDHECGVDWGSDCPKSPSEFIDRIIQIQYERVHRASIFEKIDGGVPDMGLSTEMDRLVSYISTKDNMGRDRLSISVEASGAPRQSGGILSQLFGGGQKQVATEEAPKMLEVEETEAIEIKDKEKVKLKK